MQDCLTDIVTALPHTDPANIPRATPTTSHPQAHQYMTPKELGRTFQVDHPDDGKFANRPSGRPVGSLTSVTPSQH